jgi:DNA-binding MarR family transcriptional regulator
MEHQVRGIELIDTLDTDQFDQPHELLAEHANITIPQAKRALDWMKEQGESQHDHDLADTILRVLAILIPASNTLNAFLIGVRAVSLKWLLRPESENMTALAARVGISKQLLSHHILEMERITGLHASAQKAPQTREVYAEAARQRWKDLDAQQRRARRNSTRYRRHIAEMAAQAGLTLEEAVGLPAPQATPVANLTICNG